MVAPRSLVTRHAHGEAEPDPGPREWALVACTERTRFCAVLAEVGREVDAATAARVGARPGDRLVVTPLQTEVAA